jgi:hypothetical protein
LIGVDDMTVVKGLILNKAPSTFEMKKIIQWHDLVDWASGHDQVGDLISFLISLLAMYLSKKPATRTMSFGFHRAGRFLCFLIQERFVYRVWKMKEFETRLHNLLNFVVLVVRVSECLLYKQNITLPPLSLHKFKQIRVTPLVTIYNCKDIVC